MNQYLIATVVSVTLSGCTVTVTPLPKKPAPVTRHHHGVAKSHVVSSSYRKVTPQWMNEYRRLQASHGGYTINDDRNIQVMPDGSFLVPSHVYNHYQDLSRAQPSPTP